MKPPEPLRASPARRVGVADMILGALGGFVIAATLKTVRAWAWISRTPYYRD